MKDASPRMPWRERAAHPVTRAAVAGGVAIGLAVGGLWWHLRVSPQQAMIQKRFRSTMAVAKMYGLQLAYKKAHGVYANDLNSLLSMAPDPAAVKAALIADADLNTIVVKGDAGKFRIELNVLDAGRTLIKVKGPVAPRRRPAPAVLPAPAPPMNADGGPIGR